MVHPPSLGIRNPPGACPAHAGRTPDLERLLATWRVTVPRGAARGTRAALAGGARGVAARRDPLLELLDLETRFLRLCARFRLVNLALFHGGPPSVNRANSNSGE